MPRNAHKYLQYDDGISLSYNLYLSLVDPKNRSSAQITALILKTICRMSYWCILRCCHCITLCGRGGQLVELL